jgi:hypothetical protein
MPREGQRAWRWRWRRIGDKVEAADPVGGQQVRVGHEVVVVVVTGERGAAASDEALESEVLGHGGVRVHHHEEGAEEQVTPFAVVKCEQRNAADARSSADRNGHCLELALAPIWMA